MYFFILHIFVSFIVTSINALNNKNSNCASSCTSKRRLKISSLINLAIKRNPNLAATRPRIKAASLTAERVQILDDPFFTFASMSNRINSKTEYTRENRYKFSQKIPFPGKLKTQGKIAKQALEFFKSEEITTYQNLILQTKILFFQLYFNYVAQEINNQNKKIISRFIDGALALYKTGKGTMADPLKAQTELQLLDDELLTLQSENKTLISMINALLDQPQSINIARPEENFHKHLEFNYSNLEAIAMKSRPELKGQQSFVDKQREIEKLAKLNYFPDFDFEFMLQQKPAKQATAWGISVKLNVPLWIEKKQKREAQEAKAKANANLFELQNMRAIIKGHIKEILAKLNSTEKQIQLYRTGIIPKIVQTLASNESDYKVGKGDFLTVLDTRRQFQKSELLYEGYRVEREILLAKLEKEVGVSLEKIIES